MAYDVQKIEDKIDRAVTGALTISSGSISFQNAGEVLEFSKMMSTSAAAVPKHLRGEPGACLGVVSMAIRFNMDPYALARKTFFVNDNLALEAQAIAGIILKWAPLAKRPKYEYSGAGQTRKVKVIFTLNDGDVLEYESPELKDIKPQNSPLWKTDPDQQLSYYGIRAAARRHFPDIMMGLIDVEEAQSGMIDVTPPEGTGIAAKLREAKSAQISMTDSPAESTTADTNNAAEPADGTEEAGEVLDSALVQEVSEALRDCVSVTELARLEDEFSEAINHATDEERLAIIDLFAARQDALTIKPKRKRTVIEGKAEDTLL